MNQSMKKDNSGWQKIPTAPVCTAIEQKKVSNDNEQISSIFFAHCNGAVFISMDGKYWARKSEIDGSEFVYANTTLLLMDTVPFLRETLPEGYVENPNDCNDTDTLINPSANEYCDTVDNNCDGVIDE